MRDLVIISRRVLTEDGLRPAAIHLAEGKIQAISDLEAAGEGRRLDVGEAMVFPGLVDTHVHVNEPGNTVWEGFETATRAAAAGGVTTLVDMPLNSLPVTTNPSALEAKQRRAARLARVDYGFWGGLVPGNLDQLQPLLAGGVLGFKAFLVDSGLAEFPLVTDADLRPAMHWLAEHDVPLLVHAEDPTVIAGAAGADSSPMHRYGDYLASRPDQAEVVAIERMIRLCRETGCAVHVVHLATVEALPALARARAEGLPITVESCPHYLTFAAEEIANGATLFKCAPPIRSRDNREELWRALRQGEIDLVASDHSPCPPPLKRQEEGDFRAAWGGIASLQLNLPAVWTEASKRGVAIAELGHWLCAEPARLAGLQRRKGRIAPGYDADLVIWDPDATWVVEGAALEHRHPTTAYEGRTLRGRVTQTLLRGEIIFDRGSFPGAASGRWLRRG